MCTHLYTRGTPTCNRKKLKLNLQPFNCKTTSLTSTESPYKRKSKLQNHLHCLYFITLYCVYGRQLFCLFLSTGLQSHSLPHSVPVVIIAIGPVPALRDAGSALSLCLKCVCLLGASSASQFSAPAIPPQDIWVLRRSPTGKSVWPHTPVNPSPSNTSNYSSSQPRVNLQTPISPAI